MIKHTKGLLLTLGALILAPSTASALPETEPHASAAALVGYGFHDVGGFGLGVRGGYTLRQNIYLGGTFVYHFGTTQDFVGAEQHFNMYYFGFEGGYDFQVDPVIIRPYLGLGPAFGHYSLEPCVDTVGPFSIPCSDTNTNFGIWLGGTVLYPINEQWFIGGDFKLPIVDGEVIPTLAFTGGLNF